jgi:hypothetical protein
LINEYNIEHGDRSLDWSGLAVYGLPVAAAVWVHWRCLGLFFLADDFEFWLYSDSLARAVGHLALLGGRFIRPLPALWWWADRLVWGENALGFHLDNLALHGANVALLVHLLRRLGLSGPAAALAGIIFAAHPVTVGSVAWVAARFDLLCLGFSLLALIAYFSGRARLAALVLVLALLSKEMAVLVPVIILVLDAPRPRGGEGGRKLKAWAWPAGVTLIYLLVRVIALRGMGGYAIEGAAPVSPGGLARWVPAWLASAPEWLLLRWRLAGGLGALLIVLALLRREGRSRAIAATALIWIAIIPVASILPHDTPEMNGRLMLFAVAAFAGAAGAALIDTGRLRWPSRAAAAGLAAALLYQAPGAYAPWKAASGQSRTLVAAFDRQAGAIPAGARVFIGNVPAREQGVLVMGAGLGARLAENQRRAFPGSAPPRVVSELAGLDDDYLLAQVPPESYDVILWWDAAAQDFADRTADVKAALAARERLRRSGTVLRPVVLESEDGPRLLAPFLNTTGEAGKFRADSGEPAVVGPEMRLAAWAVARVRVRLELHPLGPAPSPARVQLYWRGTRSPEFGESAKLTAPARLDGQVHEYVFAVDRDLAWLLTGDITQLRLDPLNGPAEASIELLAVEPLPSAEPETSAP